MTLNRTPSTIENFGRYLILRNEFNPPNEFNGDTIAIITDASQTSFVDRVPQMEYEWKIDQSNFVIPIFFTPPK